MSHQYQLLKLVNQLRFNNKGTIDVEGFKRIWFDEDGVCYDIKVSVLTREHPCEILLERPKLIPDKETILRNAFYELVNMCVVETILNRNGLSIHYVRNGVYISDGIAGEFTLTYEQVDLCLKMTGMNRRSLVDAYKIVFYKITREQKKQFTENMRLILDGIYFQTPYADEKEYAEENYGVLCI